MGRLDGKSALVAGGGIDVLLDSAGISTTASVLDLTHEAWDRVLAVNLTGMFLLGQAVAPGPTLTGLTRDRFADDEVREWTLSRIPLGRIGEPFDLAGAILYLASDDARWVTGTTIVVDGGYLAE